MVIASFTRFVGRGRRSRKIDRGNDCSTLLLRALLEWGTAVFQ